MDEPAGVEAVRDCNWLTHRYVTTVNAQVSLRGVALFALFVASTVGSVPAVVGVLYAVATFVIFLVSWRDTRRITYLTRVSQIRREAVWHDTAKVIAMLRRDIAHGPPNGLNNEWYRWNWRALSWWTRQVSDLLSAGSVASAVGLVFQTPLAAVAAGAAYLLLLGYLAVYEARLFTAQRQAILDAMIKLRTPQDPAAESGA